MLPCGYAYLDGDDEAESYHLHIVVSDADKDGDAIVVSVSTIYRLADRTVIVKAHEHSWLRHDSYVAYGFAKLQKVAEIEARLAVRPNMKKDPCSASLLTRIQEGITQSEQTENGVKHFYRELHPGSSI
jgi:hypothetical protein